MASIFGIKIPTMNELTGEQAARDKEEAIGAATSTKNNAYEVFKQKMIEAQQAQMPWFLQAMQEYQNNYQTGRNDLLRGQDQGEAALRQGLGGGLNALGIGLQGGLGQLAQGGQNATLAELLRYTQDLGNTREGMDIDTKSLNALLQQSLASVSPYMEASQKMLGVLPGMMGEMGMGGAGLPQSLGAAIQMADSNRIVQNAMQRQGLSGSGMEAAQMANARRRVLADDQQAQWGKANDLLKTGMSGANLGSQVMSNFIQPLGSIGNRLGQVKGMDLSGTMADLGKAGATLYNNYGNQGASLYQNYGDQSSNLAGRFAELLSKGAWANQMPEWLSNMGTTTYNNILNPAGVTLQQGSNSADAQALIGNVQHPGLLDTAGKIASIGSSLFGAPSGGTSTYTGMANAFKKILGM